MDGGAAGLSVTRSPASDATERARLATPEAKAAAFRSLLDEHLDAVYVRATVLLGNRFEAEDAVHDAAERAWQRWSSLNDRERFEAWFGRILLNVCRDRLRRRRRVAVIETELVDGGDSPLATDTAQGTAERDRVRRLLDALTADERIVVVLRFESDLTVPAIAALLGVPEGTVKSRLHRALNRLRATGGGDRDD